MSTNTMTHKDYTARIDYDDRDGIFVGRLLGHQEATGSEMRSAR